MASPYRTTTDRRRRRIHLAGIALAAFLTGMAAAGHLSARSQTTTEDRGGPRQERPSRAAAATVGDRTAPGPTTEVDGVPAGFARSEQGAVAAAASFVTTGQALLDMDPLAAEQAVRRMAASSTADAQAADVLARLAAVREVLAPGTGPIVFRQSGQPAGAGAGRVAARRGRRRRSRARPLRARRTQHDVSRLRFCAAHGGASSVRRRPQPRTRERGRVQRVATAAQHLPVTAELADQGLHRASCAGHRRHPEPGTPRTTPRSSDEAKFPARARASWLRRDSPAGGERAFGPRRRPDAKLLA